MRKLIVLAVVAVTALAVAVTAIAATNQAGLVMKITPAKKGTKKKPRYVALDTTVSTTTPDGSPPDATTKAAVSFAKGFVFNTKYFKTCSAATAQQDQTQCPKGSKVGTGTSTIVAVNGANKIESTATVAAYNGPKSGGKPTINLVATATSPVQQTITLVGVLNNASGKYGKRLDVTVPPISVLGFTVRIKTFQVKVKATGKKGSKKIGYVQAPTKCKGSWPFSVTNTYEGGATSTADTTVKCK